MDSQGAVDIMTTDNKTVFFRRKNWGGEKEKKSKIGKKRGEREKEGKREEKKVIVVEK